MKNGLLLNKKKIIILILFIIVGLPGFFYFYKMTQEGEKSDEIFVKYSLNIDLSELENLVSVDNYNLDRKIHNFIISRFNLQNKIDNTDIYRIGSHSTVMTVKSYTEYEQNLKKINFEACEFIVKLMTFDFEKKKKSFDLEKKNLLRFIYNMKEIHKQNNDIERDKIIIEKEILLNSKEDNYKQFNIEFAKSIEKLNECKLNLLIDHAIYQNTGINKKNLIKFIFIGFYLIPLLILFFLALSNRIRINFKI